MKDNAISVRLFLDQRDNGIHTDKNTLASQNSSDFFVTFLLKRTFNKVDEYTDVSIDPLKTIMNRQEINPWFIEFGLFRAVKHVQTGTTANLIDKAGQFNITINA